jgi:uncharacterized protein
VKDTSSSTNTCTKERSSVPSPFPKMFATDQTLHRLCRWLRFCGFDTVGIDKNKAPHDSQVYSRILLTRCHNRPDFYNQFLEVVWIESDNYIRQLTQVLERYDLKTKVQLFSRCGICNGSLHAWQDENPPPGIPSSTKEWVKTYWMCKQCGKVYWKGTHYENTHETLTELGLIQSGTTL